MAKHTTGRPLKTVETAVELLDLLDGKKGHDLGTIANELGLAKSTIHGYLSTLKRYGYVYEEAGEFYIGAELLTLGGQVRYRRPSYQLAIEEVEMVSDHTSERSQFIIEEGGKGVHLHVVKGNKGVKVNSRIGKRSHLHASAAGKTILAWSPESKVDEIIEKWKLPKLTENTITDPEVLKEELVTVRERGFAQNREESIEGLHAIGIPVKSNGNMIGSISVSGPSRRISGDKFEKEIPDFLLGVSNELELRISYEDKY